MNHIKVVEKAIKFEKPGYIPMELVDVPHIYNAYDTLNPEKLEFIPGTENFDSAWATYHWTFEYLGKNEKGELLRRDEWGCIQKVPYEKTSTYVVLENPLKFKDSLNNFNLPDVKITDNFFKNLKKNINKYYPDRFICGYIDPGPVLIACNLMSYEYFLLKIAEDVDFVVSLLKKIFEFHHKLIPRWKDTGVHMVNVIDEFAGSSGLMFNPEIFRKFLKPLYQELFEHIHKEGMYTGILLDGDIKVVIDDLLAMDIDVTQFLEPNAVGIDVIKDRIKGKKCIKCSVDMKETLAKGSPEDVKKEVNKLVEELNSDEGGFMFIALKWYRPSYPYENVIASIQEFNKLRKK